MAKSKGAKKSVKTAIVCALMLLCSFAAHAQRYDSSYGYEMRGLIPPDPVPRSLRDYDRNYDNERARRAHTERSDRQRRY